MVWLLRLTSKNVGRVLHHSTDAATDTLSTNPRHGWLLQQELVERQAAVLHLLGDSLADVTDVPRFRRVSRDGFLAIRIADNKPELVGIVPGTSRPPGIYGRISWL